MQRSWLLGLAVVQGVCAAYFLGDAALDVAFGPDQDGQWEIVAEVIAALGLALGLVLGWQAYRMLSERSARAEVQTAVARGAFGAVVAEKFRPGA